MSLKLRALALALMAANLLSGCGGGGDSVTTTLSGVASKGPLKAALVTAYPVSDAGVVGSTEITHATTDGTGAYTLDLGAYTGAVQLAMTATVNTTTADEATGQDVALPATFTLHANTVITAATGNQIQSASITPYTELANNIAKDSGGITASNIASANGVVFALIGVDPVATVPLASNAAPSAGATDAQKRYALFNAAVSKLASSTPQTADAETLTCYTDAGSDLGKKIQCASQQIATSVTVLPGSGAQAGPAVNDKLVGLSVALVSVAADPDINKTGTTIATTDSAVKTLEAVETAAASGTQTPISGGTSTQTRTDVAAAKLFFSGLRSNAAALKTDTVSTGIVDGMKAFGDSLKGEAAALTINTLQVVRLGDIARSLWTNYTTGATTSADSPAINGFPGGCTVYQGALPTFGGTTGANLQPYGGVSTTATTTANAKWVGCSVNSGPLPSDGTRRYRQTMVFDMSTDTTLAVVPFLAITRAQYIDGTGIKQQNLTPTLSGTAGFTVTGGNLVGFSLVGDLPPATTLTGVLLAQRYPVNIAGQMTPLSSGAFQAAFSSGKLGSVPVGATEAGLTIDISSNGESVAVIPQDNTNAAQLAAAKVNFAATISDAKGRLTGGLLIDQISADSATGKLVPGHIKFSGEIAVAPVVGGIAGDVVSFLSGSIEATNGSTPVVSFSGSLTLPNRPAATLSGSVTETSTDVFTLEARYVQAGVIVTLNGTKTVGDTTATFADSTGVSVSLSKLVNSANVKVSGRQTAVIDKDAKTITYSDGTFESLI